MDIKSILFPSESIEYCFFIIVEIGLNPTLKYISLPLLIPPCIPPEKFVLVFPVASKKTSLTSLPLLEDMSLLKNPYLNECTALILSMALPIFACNLSKTGSPNPEGTPFATAKISPPIESPSFLTVLISEII